MRTKIYIKGMYCSTCESTVEKQLNSVKGVQNCKANAGAGYAVVGHNENFSYEQAKAKLRKKGYEVYKYKSIGSDKNNKPKNIIAIIVLLLILILGKYLVPSFDSSYTKISLGLVFLFGILNSFHCASMCGGLIVTQIISKSNDNHRVVFFQYFMGRLISYTSVGILLGGLGEIISISDKLKAIISIGSGVLMILFALQMIGIVKLPRIQLYKGKGKIKSSFTFGILNGFLPCGALQVMQLYALGSKSYILGGLIMLIFAIATSLSLLLVGILSSRANFTKSNNFKYIGFSIILFLGLQFLSQGYSELSILNSNTIEGLPIVEEGVEYKEINLIINTLYYIDTNEIKVGEPVKMNLVPIRVDGCNNPFKIKLPEGITIEVDLENNSEFITFTPQQTGKIEIVCWMNMRRTFITVK